MIFNDEFKIRKKNDYNIDLKSDILIHNIKENEYIKENQIDISISYKEDEEDDNIIEIFKFNYLSFSYDFNFEENRIKNIFKNYIMNLIDFD